MIIKMLTVGEFASNNYLIICEKTKEAALIDAGGDFEATMREIDESHATLKYIFYTHAHFDHISGDYELKKKTHAKTYMHIDDKFLADKFKEQLMMFGVKHIESPVIDEYVKDRQILTVGDLNFEVIHTPGHSPGSVCYFIDKTLFAGDTLFADSVGRTDLPGGSYDQLRDSVINRLFVLDDEVKVYPGHGGATTIGYEKEKNPFFGRKAEVK